MNRPKKAVHNRTRSRAHARGSQNLGGQSSARKADLQQAAFYLSVDGKTYREIAEILSINKGTVCKYVRAENELRATELSERREVEKARRIARLQYLSKLAEESRAIPGSGALNACAKFEEMINRIMGVDSPTKVDLGMQELLAAIDIPDEEEPPK